MLKDLEMQIKVNSQVNINMHRTEDNHLVESIAYYGDQYNKNIVAITNQIGCYVGCGFCYVGEQGFKRNITAEEYLQQVDAVNKELIPDLNTDKRLKVSFCRAGEPLLNQHTLDGIIQVADKYYSNLQLVSVMPNKKVSQNLLENIADFAKDYHKPFQIVISTHTTDEERRREIIPYNSLMTFDEISEFGKYWIGKGNKRKINLHFALMKGNEVDLTKIKEKFNPDHFAVRLGLYLPSTEEKADNFPPSDLQRIKEKAKEARDLGFTTIKSIARPIELKYDVRSHCSFKLLREHWK